MSSWGPLTLGKTYVYCSSCELIVAHKHELEAQLAHTFEKVAPEVVGNEYLVLGGLVASREAEQGAKQAVKGLTSSAPPNKTVHPSRD